MHALQFMFEPLSVQGGHMQQVVACSTTAAAVIQIASHTDWHIICLDAGRLSSRDSGAATAPHRIDAVRSHSRCSR